MLFKLNKYDKALEAYESDLKKHPGRFNAIYGAGLSAEHLNNGSKAQIYYKQLLTVSVPNSTRQEIAKVNQFLKVRDL